MAAHTEAHRQHTSLPSPHPKSENCYLSWTSVDWRSNRSPVPAAQEEEFEASNCNSSHTWYTISHSEHSDMGPIVYPGESGVESNQTNSYPSYRSNLSASPPVSGRKNYIYRPVPPHSTMNVVTSNVSPGLSSQRRPHYAPASIGSPNIYSSSPRNSNGSIGNGSLHAQFPSQIKYDSLTSISESQPSSLPSSFSTAPALAPPAMNRTHSGTILKSNERRLFNPSNSLPQISFQQNSPDAPPPGEIKGEFESAPPSIFGHSDSPYHKHDFDHGLQLYPIALPGMASVHPTPFTNGGGPNTYFTPPHAHHIDGVPTTHPQGLLTEAFGEPNPHYRKRDYSIMDAYPQWSSPDGIPTQKPVKRRKSSATQPWQLSDDDRYLMKLKDEDQLPWKEIVNRFKEEGRGTHRVPALQMRLKRIKERIRQWTPEDEKLLDDAKKWLDKNYWEIVSSKMIEYGRKEKIPGTSCEKKWKELNARRESERDSKSGSGRLLHDDLPPHSQCHSTATSPTTNFSGYDEEDGNLS
ncbi:hypothetical protein H072_5829 [Dactylellina haptotyla CBS 200.50]|uniref:Myb-like domain-containing protein n=1 Tax=Dactylellina haptotyla (strain CBS 200.50) TaxID=1284197 RepID=S8BLS0_DACHA|nr:hypothetical protein H072_5829 [Dactylellina haptotyla CBS 200.50]